MNVRQSLDCPVAILAGGLIVRGWRKGINFLSELSRIAFAAGRYYWALFKGQQAYNRSQPSFATKREAAAEGAKVLKKRIAVWQAAR